MKKVFSIAVLCWIALVGALSVVKASPATVITNVELQPDMYGFVDRSGSTDVGALINQTIVAAKSCSMAGNATVRLRAGIYLITTPIVPKSCITLQGDGRGKTVLLTNSSAPFAQTSGSQLVHFNIEGITFKDSGSHSGATVLSFTAIQGSRISNIGFSGYSTGTLMSIAGASVTSFDDSASPFNGSNSILNYFSDWIADGCSIGVQEAGVYGATPTGSPANSSNAPSIVVTQNLYDDLSLFNVTGKAIDIVKAADTEVFRHIVVFASSNSAVGVQIGDDYANFPGNNYVNSIRVQLSLSLAGSATSMTAFEAGDWTFGNIFDLETDINPSSLTAATTQGGNVTQFNYRLCGKNSNPALVGSFNVTTVCSGVGTAMIQSLTTPASSSASCGVGQVEWDANFVYICTAANTWKRAALSTF